MIVYRHNDSRYPFLWEDGAQPAARWHRPGEGPVHYFADTPGGAWAEFLRHEEITEEGDLEGVSRALWAVEIGDPDVSAPALPDDVVTGGLDSYSSCQGEAARLRAEGATALVARSAALGDGAAHGWRVELGFRMGPRADGRVFVLFGRRPELVGWLVVDRGRPPAELLTDVRHL
ncbi:MAG TPA: RES domain-containing protein [Acidimicrobiales bacterium]|nr:RES domain-containing protein [Acidimicrobiales bacterium]